MIVFNSKLSSSPSICKNIDDIDGNDESFEPDYFWSFTMFKHHNSGLYMGCDNSGNAKLFEVKKVEYPDPQILFVLTEVDQLQKTTNEE